MKVNAELACSSILIALIMMLSATTVRAESALPLNDKTKTLFEKIQDLELMQRNVVECYQAEKRAPGTARLSTQCGRDYAELDGKLMNRVFGHLAGTPEYEKFITEYRTILQSPDYRRLRTERLFAEYMLLLESGRTRLMTQWKSLQEGLTEDGSDQLPEGIAESIQVKKVTFGHAEGSQSRESARTVPAIRLRELTLSGSKPLVVIRKSVSWIVVHGMDPSRWAGTPAPTIDLMDLNRLVVPAQGAP